NVPGVKSCAFTRCWAQYRWNLPAGRAQTRPRSKGSRMDGSVETTRDRIRLIEALTRKTLWLSNWMIHHANHIRPNPDGLKVGGHQASSASMTAILSALYFGVLRPEDRVAVKPHAAPVFHAIQYLFGKQSLDKLKAFRGYGGAQSYPSRTKDS